MSGKKKRPALIIFCIVIIIILAPLVAVGISFLGRIAPDSVLPDSFDYYASVPDPVHFARLVLNHEPLPDILALAELAPLVSNMNQLKDSGLTENKWVRYAAGGRLDVVFLPTGQLLAAWDSGVLSPFVRLLPVLAGRLNIPGLYYVNAGRNSRFEFRLDDGTVFFIGPYKNLLVISNNSSLYESVISGSSREKTGAREFISRNYDAVFLLSPTALLDTLKDGDPQLLSALGLLKFPGPIEASLSILPNQLRLHLVSHLESDNAALRNIIGKNSRGTPLTAMIPDSAQYMTLLSAGSLKELMDAVSAIRAGGLHGANFETTMRRADSSARAALGMNLEELLFSWSGSQFAVYGLEGRPNPLIAIEIKDEGKRKQVFDRAFRSLFVSENVQLVLDGNRIPRIQLPGFLDSLLSLMNVHVPSPYYTVQGNYLFISESAETLLAAVNSVRRNEVLPKQQVWRTLSEDNQGPSSFYLYYSLDNSVPFFLRGSGAILAVLKSYRQGLTRLHLENRLLNISLSVFPGVTKGLAPLSGYPLDLTALGRTGNQLYRISSGRDSRLLLTRGSNVLAVNPTDRTIKELHVSGPPGTSLYVIPADNSMGAWVVNSQGYVSLVNKDLENLRGFPLITGVKLSAPPGAWGGRLFLPGEDGSVHTVDSNASINLWGMPFSSALRSPPSFLDFKNSTYAAVYPKSFFGEIFLLDSSGFPLEGWPVPVSGIAFGSPLLFIPGEAQYAGMRDRLFAAFITQAGELTVHNETAETLPGFPLELKGVFYLQPVFDGENLWIIESEGTLYRVSLNAEVLSIKIPRLLIREEGYITFAKTELSDGGVIFFSGEGNALYGYSGNFTALEGFPLPVWGRPVFADVNGDGKQELAGVGMDNKLYVWGFR